LKSLDELPSLSEIRDIDKINAELDFGQDQQVMEALAPRLAEQTGGEMVEDEDATISQNAGNPVEDAPDAPVLH
jgi:segregation and condensation protein B